MRFKRCCLSVFRNIINCRILHIIGPNTHIDRTVPIYRHIMHEHRSFKINTGIRYFFLKSHLLIKDLHSVISLIKHIDQVIMTNNCRRVRKITRFRAKFTVRSCPVSLYIKFHNTVVVKITNIYFIFQRTDPIRSPNSGLFL